MQNRILHAVLYNTSEVLVHWRGEIFHVVRELLFPVLIIFQLTNAFSYLGHKGCLSMIKLGKISIAKKEFLVFHCPEFSLEISSSLFHLQEPIRECLNAK